MKSEAAQAHILILLVQYRVLRGVESVSRACNPQFRHVVYPFAFVIFR